jgi:hypothetical protein
MLISLRTVLLWARSILVLWLRPCLRPFGLRLAFLLLRPRWALLLPGPELVRLALFDVRALLRRRSLPYQWMLRSRYVLTVGLRTLRWLTLFPVGRVRPRSVLF